MRCAALERLVVQVQNLWAKVSDVLASTADQSKHDLEADDGYRYVHILLKSRGRSLDVDCPLAAPHLWQSRLSAHSMWEGWHRRGARFELDCLTLSRPCRRFKLSCVLESLPLGGPKLGSGASTGGATCHVPRGGASNSLRHMFLGALECRSVGSMGRRRTQRLF